MGDGDGATPTRPAAGSAVGGSGSGGGSAGGQPRGPNYDVMVPTPERARGGAGGSGAVAGGGDPAGERGDGAGNTSCYVLGEVTADQCFLLHKLVQLEYNGRALAARALHLTTAEGAASAPAEDVASVITLVVVGGHQADGALADRWSGASRTL